MTTDNLFDLTGRRVLVTGSSRGIGLALARGLGRAGAELILNGRNSETLQKAVESLKADGLQAVGKCFDITDENAVIETIIAIESDLGPIDILINNAGIQRRFTLLEMEKKAWDEVIGTNLTGAFLVSRAIAKGMISRKAGKIINICSMMSEVARPTVGNYTAAKGGLKMLTRAMTVEWAPHNIQINGIGPGYFETEMTKPLRENKEFDSWIKSRTPAGRWGKPEELVGAAIFLASRASDFVNGQILYVDGGLLASV